MGVLVFKLSRGRLFAKPETTLHHSDPLPQRSLQALWRITPGFTFSHPQPDPPWPAARFYLDASTGSNSSVLIAELYQAGGNCEERQGGANLDGGVDRVLSRAERRVAVQCKYRRIGKVRPKAGASSSGLLRKVVKRWGQWI